MASFKALILGSFFLVFGPQTSAQGIGFLGRGKPPVPLGAAPNPPLQINQDNVKKLQTLATQRIPLVLTKFGGPALDQTQLQQFAANSFLAPGQQAPAVPVIGLLPFMGAQQPPTTAAPTTAAPTTAASSAAAPTTSNTVGYIGTNPIALTMYMQQNPSLNVSAVRNQLDFLYPYGSPVIASNAMGMGNAMVLAASENDKSYPLWFDSFVQMQTAMARAGPAAGGPLRALFMRRRPGQQPSGQGFLPPFAG